MASTNPIPSPGESRTSGVAEKVGSSSLWVPAPALPLLLLLLLPPPLLSPGSFLHRLPAWRNFHQGTRHYRSKTEKLKTCEGTFDLYFILDTSETAKDSWKDIYTFVEKMVKKYPNPKLRVSFITYSTEGHTLLKLTSDKNKIRDGLAELQNVVPTGATHMQEGFIKVNEQIKEANSGGPSTSNLIITVTTAPIPSTSLPMINFEVNKAVRMKSTVYFVAYKDYKKEELRNIVQTPSQVYEAEGFQSLNRMLNSLVGNSCTKVTSETTYFVCLKEDYSVRYRIPSSYQSRKDEILCRYKLKDNSVYEKKPYRISQNNIFCPRHEFQKDGEMFQSDYTLDNGKTYEGNLKITAIFCPCKELPAVQIIQRDSNMCTHTCTRLTLPSCRFQENNMRWIEGKLDTLCDFVQCYNQMPLLWYQPRSKVCCLGKMQALPYHYVHFRELEGPDMLSDGRCAQAGSNCPCFNFILVNPHCRP